MKTSITKLSLFLFLIFFQTNNCFSQLAVPFKVRYQSYVKGDMTVIANNITNRKDLLNGTGVAYDNQNNSAKHNDEFQMEYIDIDDDKSTFSSSSATLNLENQSNKKIIYAGLYWSSTYKYNSGKKKSDEKFVAKDPTREIFDEVKIKLPNQENYTTISGQIIYDGINQKEFTESAPFAVYADITKEINAIENPFGIYTVANIKATQGMISGGIASGWTIFFIYEDETMTGKFITSFDGFAGVTDRSTDIVFDGFETLPEGNVKAKLATAALEGDNGLSGDQFLFKTLKKNKFVTLSNDLRKQNNFFNSSITVDNQNFTNRIPNSKNTLGYDTCLISILNADNAIIGNNTKEATLRLKSSGDRYFMFFTAFEVEVTEPENLIIPEELDLNSVASESINSKKLLNNKEIFLLENESQKQIMQSNIKPELTDIKCISIQGFPKGYYIIANVFSKKSNCNNFIKNLKNKGIIATSFFNPDNNYNYVFLEKSNDKTEIESLYSSKINNRYSDDIWILSVNNGISLISSNND